MLVNFPIQGSQCCGYGARGVFSQGMSPYATANMAVGYDCVSIPGARGDANAIVPPRVCGRGKGLVTAEPGSIAKSICCKSTLTIVIGVRITILPVFTNTKSFMSYS
jgi:hypothetical protein